MSGLTAPGSVLWLLRHELRLFWRGVWSTGKGKTRVVWLAIAAVAVVVVAFALGIPFAFAVRELDIGTSPLWYAGVAVGLAVTGSLMVAQALNAATVTLYERRDLDLLLSSPLPAARLLTVRALAIALSCVALFAALASPFAISMAIVGRPEWLAIYPVLGSLALTATALGLSICMGLFALVGPRATRTIAQILAGLVGAGFFLLSQSGNIVGRNRGQAVMERAREAAESGWFDAGAPGSWPARALLGEPLPLLALTAVGVALFALTVGVLGRRFAADAAAAAGAASGGRRKKASGGPLAGFSDASLMRVMIGKELRLLRRDPWLISQVFLQLLYLLPLIFIVFNRSDRFSEWIIPGVAGGIAFLAAQLTGNLAWITVSAEDAPDLLASSPATRRDLDRAKAAAAILPVAVLMAVPVLGLLTLSPVAGVAAALGVGAAAISSALVNIWWQKPANRRDIKRGRRSSWLVSLAETALAFCWSSAAALLAMLQPWWLFPACFGVALTVLLRRPSRTAPMAAT